MLGVGMDGVLPALKPSAKVKNWETRSRLPLGWTR